MAGSDLDTFTTFGECLRILRHRARLTQRELGIAVGYSDVHIARLENGQRLPDLDAVRARFIEALDLQREPALAKRLVELAEQERSDQPGHLKHKGVGHPFGDLLGQYRARKAGLTLARLANLAGYDKVIVVRMGQGHKDLTGPTGRERVVRVMGVLHQEGVLATLEEANTLLKVAGMSPLYPDYPDEAALVRLLQSGDRAAQEMPAVGPTSASRSTNLPAQLTRFIGREQEATEVQRLLATTRLLTLTGSGGCGKTRLAIEVAARCALGGETHADAMALASPGGVWLVELAPIADPALVADTVALALGLHASTRPAMAMLTDHLRDKTALLLLDNCEHLLQACAELVEALLRACPGLHVLVTSREGLNLPGETRWRVPPLLTAEAVQLFVEHARAAQPGFTLTDHNAPVIAQVCERLDGMPLAIELAAARVHAFSVDQIAARLDDRFRLLTGGSRTALPRHQTLRATIDWSYDLLSEEERALLRRLSVFAGGWTLDAAEALYGSADVLDLLAQLVSKSLVVADASATGDGTRYRMLETIRQYAHDRLVDAGEYEAACQRHLAYFAGLAHTASTHWFGPAPKPWLDRLETELDNLRAALDWVARNQDVHAGDRLIGWMFEFWYNRGYAVEGMRWIDAILPPSAVMSDATRLNRRMWLGQLAHRNSDYVQARERWGEAAALAHQLADERLIVSVNFLLSQVTADDAEAVQFLSDAIRLAQRDESTPAAHEEAIYHLSRRLHIAADAMHHLGRRMCMAGDYPAAAHWLAASAHAYRESDNSMYLAYSLGWLGMVALGQGDYVQARAQFEASSALSRQCGHTVGTAEWLLGLSRVAVYQGDYGSATAALQEALPTYYKMGNLYRVAQGLMIAAHLAQDCGQPERAARLLGAAGAIWRDFSAEFRWLQPDLHMEYARGVPAVRAALDEMTFDTAWAEGQQMSIPQAIAVALAGE